VDRLPLSYRAKLYRDTFPQFPDSWPWVETGRWLNAIWVTGNDYRGSGYYGSYPRGYLPRVLSLFPDRVRTLHVFSGSLPPRPGEVRVDLLPNPDARADVKADARHLPFGDRTFDLVLADPPYSSLDAERYGTTMPSRLAVVREIARVLEPGGYLVWLDLVRPMYRKSELEGVGLIGIVRSTNHRVRLATIFRRR